MPHFNAFPPEIRHMIYRCLFYMPDGLKPLSRDRERLAVQLLRASQQVSREAAGVLYSENLIVLYENQRVSVHKDYIMDWLKAIGPRNRAMIRRLWIDWVYWPWSAAMSEFTLVDIMSCLEEHNTPWNDGVGRALYACTMTAKAQICKTLDLLAGSCSPEELTLLFPGRNAANFDLDWRPNGIYGFFDKELFREETELDARLAGIPGIRRMNSPYMEMHDKLAIASLLKANEDFNIRTCLMKFRGVKELTVGDTTDLEGLEKCAKEMGVWKVVARWRDWDNDRKEAQTLECKKNGWVFASETSKLTHASFYQRYQASKVMREANPPPHRLIRASFLGLPLEIRREIYKYIYVRDCSVEPVSMLNQMGDHFRPGIGLLLASRQVSREACSVLYGFNTFDVFTDYFREDYDVRGDLDSKDFILNFFQKIGPRNRRMIRNLKIDWTAVVESLSAVAETRLMEEAIFVGAGPLVKFLAKALKQFERHTCRQICDVLDILANDSLDRLVGFDTLRILLPGNDCGRTELRNDGFFQHEMFASYKTLRDTLKRIKGGIGTLWLGETVDFANAEECAREMSVKELVCFWRVPEEDHLVPEKLETSTEINETQSSWLKANGWVVENNLRRARKLLTSETGAIELRTDNAVPTTTLATALTIGH